VAQRSPAGCTVDLDLGVGKDPFCVCDAALVAPARFDRVEMERLSADALAFACQPIYAWRQRVRIRIGERSNDRDVPFPLTAGGRYGLRVTSGRLRVLVFGANGAREVPIDVEIPAGFYRVDVTDADVNSEAVESLVRSERGEDALRGWRRADLILAVGLGIVFVAALLFLVTPFASTRARGLTLAGLGAVVGSAAALFVWRHLRGPHVRDVRAWVRRVVADTPKLILELHRASDREADFTRSGVHEPPYDPGPEAS